MTTTQSDPAPLVPLHVRELRATGFARPERETAALARVRHGSYLFTADWDQAPGRERYLALLRATSTLTARPPLLSHASPRRRR